MKNRNDIARELIRMWDKDNSSLETLVIRAINFGRSLEKIRKGNKENEF